MLTAAELEKLLRRVVREECAALLDFRVGATDAPTDDAELQELVQARAEKLRRARGQR